MPTLLSLVYIIIGHVLHSLDGSLVPLIFIGMFWVIDLILHSHIRLYIG